MTRRQARRMIRHESVITALIGAALGLPLGIFLAALVTQALSSTTSRSSIPVTELVAFTVVAILAGIARGDHARPPRLAARTCWTRCSTNGFVLVAKSALTTR